MDNLEIRRKHRRLAFIIIGASFTWAVILCIWMFVGKNSSLGIMKALFSYPWAIISLVLGIQVLIWIVFWRRKLNSKDKRIKVLLFLKLCSDALLIALIAGVLWHWPPAVIIPILIGLVLSYAVKLINSVYAVATDRSIQVR
jgi:hypothetical protein